MRQAYQRSRTAHSYSRVQTRSRSGRTAVQNQSLSQLPPPPQPHPTPAAASVGGVTVSGPRRITAMVRVSLWPFDLILVQGGVVL